jgi:hypothetical protein
LSSSARAQEGAATPAVAPSETPSADSDSSKKTGGGKRTREKEAEGTEARDRFKADTVIKSKYKLDGQPLEVDPD